MPVVHSEIMELELHGIFVNLGDLPHKKLQELCAAPQNRPVILAGI